MAQNYACMNFGSCTDAGVPRSGPSGVAPACPACGSVMAAQGSAGRIGGARNAARILGMVLLALIAVLAAWKIATWSYYRTVGYDILGRWRAEQTSVMGFNLPVGVNIEFARDSATIFDAKLAVAEYERDGNRIHVILQPDQRMQINLSFTFEDSDHMKLDGPLGVTLRYRRVKAPQ